jgi:peptidyl-prolyl cis-trans isomerase C
MHRLPSAAALMAAALLALMPACGCGHEKAPAAAERVLAVVNGEPVTLGQLEHRMELLNLGFDNVSSDEGEGEARLEALSQLIDEAVCLQEAKRLGITVTPAEVESHVSQQYKDFPKGALENELSRSGLSMEEFKDEARKKLIIEKLIDSQVYSRLDTTDTALKAFFRKHKDEFRRPMQVRARQIVVESEQEARDILKEIKAGADFAETAKKRSLSPDSEAGGDLGYFSKGDMPPEFEEVVFRMKKGELSGVVHTPYGYHIFLVEDIRPALNPHYEDVKALVRKRYLANVGEAAYKDWQSALRAKASIEIHPELLGGL